MDNHEDRIDDPPPVPKIKSYKEAIQSLEDIQDFLERRGCIEEAMGIASKVDMIANLRITSSRQTTLLDYF